MDRFTGKVVMITGGAHGIGAGCAERFLAEGALAAIIDLDGDSLTRRFADTPSDRLFTMAGDCTDAGVLDQFHRDASRTLGPVDVLFNNVGRSAREDAGPFHESDETVWRGVIETSLMTTIRLSRLVAPVMRERGGSIINMSSDAAFVGDAGLADYAAAKMGVIGFTRALARELAPFRTTINAIAPGAIRTQAHDRLPKSTIDRIKQDTPAGFIGEVADVAGVVCFLASAEARYITGQTVLVDGGRWMV